MGKQTVRFENADGHTLHGNLYSPPGPPRAYVLFAHCFTCTANVKAAVNIARALTELGFAVLSFDFTGLGESEGDFSETNFATNLADLRAAAAFLEASYEPPAMLVGHSLGGTAVLAMAGDVPSCRAVVTIAAPARAAHVGALLGERRDEIDRLGEAVVNIGERPFRIKKQFLEDIERHEVPQTLPGLRCALLVMHAPLDTIVSVDNASEIFRHAVHPKSFVSLDKADHLLSRSEDARYAAAVLAAWAGRYVSPADAAAKPSPPSDESALARTGSEGFLTEIVVGGHALTADEPASVGGSDEGPSPYGLLGAALASCTSMTLQLYARRKGLALDEAIVRVEHSKVHAEDCEECETREGRVDRLTRLVTLVGELDAAERQRMLEIADRCPVHRTLTGEVSIVSSLAPGD